VPVNSSQKFANVDIIERFHLSLLLTLILLRNLIEHTNSLTTTLNLPWMDLCMPFIMVLGSELLVDWCKHAFVTKFNHIRPSVYGRFIDVLCLDFVKDGREVFTLTYSGLTLFRLLLIKVQLSHGE
jgi:Eukaryotic membrane protein family